MLLKKLRKKGARAALVGSSLLVGVGAGLLGIGSAPAGATTGLQAPVNHTLVGAGSNTDYDMMVRMDVLFDESQGCNPIAITGQLQPLNYSCPAKSNPVFPPLGTNGKPDYGYTENPVNDVAMEESPFGSSNGIAELEDQGNHGKDATVPVANNISYARSSRDLSSSDLKGLNFVAYAKDGVTWFHFTEVGGKATPSANVSNLSLTQLQAIYGSTSASGAITNWKQVGGTSAPIDVFSAQEGSGTEGTWKTALGFDPSSGEVAAIQDGTKYHTNNVLPENEDQFILDLGTQAVTDAIFLFSVGKYNLSCEASATNCGGSPLPAGTTNAIGKINGVTATQKTILGGTFPIVRYLYNVYSNGSNKNIPGSSPATLNYISEDGFMCKPQKTTSTGAQTASGTQTLDPLTGVWYHKEIEDIIESEAFIPLPNGAPDPSNSTPGDEGSVPHTAESIFKEFPKNPYNKWDNPPLSSNGNPEGYCLVSSTDGNSTS